MATKWQPLTDGEILAQIPAARERGSISLEQEVHAASARFDRGSGWTVLELTSGCMFAFPPDIDELRGLTPDELARVRVRPGGSGLYWEGTDAAVSVPALLNGDYHRKPPRGSEFQQPNVEVLRRRRSA